MPGANQYQPPDKHIVQRGHITNSSKGNGGVVSGKGGKGGSGTLSNIPRRHRKGGK